MSAGLISISEKKLRAVKRAETFYGTFFTDKVNHFLDNTAEREVTKMMRQGDKHRRV